MRPAWLLWHAARLFAAAVWLLAAAGKLREPVKFLGNVDQYALLPPWAVAVTALTLPGVELALGLALLLGFWVRPAAWLANGLMLAFMAGMASVMARGMELDCSCFDILGLSPEVGWGTLLRDLILMLPTLWLALGTAPARAGKA